MFNCYVSLLEGSPGFLMRLWGWPCWKWARYLASVAAMPSRKTLMGQSSYWFTGSEISKSVHNTFIITGHDGDAFDCQPACNISGTNLSSGLLMGFQAGTIHALHFQVNVTLLGKILALHQAGWCPVRWLQLSLPLQKKNWSHRHFRCQSLDCSPVKRLRMVFHLSP